MSDVSHNLALPYLKPNQAQKHVTHNEALRRLDVLVQLCVEGFSATTPPALPANGMVWALGAGASGAWAGHDNELAARIDDAWEFIPPKEGWRAYGRGNDQLRVWDGSAWVQGTMNTQNLSGVGINTSSDTTNRLSVSAPATLLNHAGTDHQLQLNKAAAGDTATLLVQSGWAGRAEMGLAGADDFSIKVSGDGSAWTTGLLIDKDDGRASLPAGAVLGGFVGVGASSEVTISAGVITVTGSYHHVDTEADAATDDLDTIQGGSEGDIVILRSTDPARSVVLRHNTGNIRCGSDRVLGSISDRIVLQYRSNSWDMISFADN
jgi:hypothetical protein